MIARGALASAAGALVARARDLAAFALPQRCPGCGARAEPERLLCDACHAAIPRVAMPLCARCLARGREPVGCTAHPGRTVWPAWLYDERAACVVHALKYQGRTGLAAGLGAELARVVPGAPRPDLVMAVPLHSARRRERGYNQAERLAESLAGRIGVPLLEGAIERVRNTPPQARLDPRSRRANVAGAFRVRHPGRLEGRSILLVDDVITTGATFEACLAALARARVRAAGVALAWAQ
ncbi:MAG TPA: double zinc ribbon domain-containing protein [Candidatus Eisenbacteria bacterium]|jgi:ComF family protein